MERAVKVRRQINVDNVVEVLLVGLCFTASFYGFALLNALPSVA
jgi:hypothetical protein